MYFIILRTFFVVDLWVGNGIKTYFLNALRQDRIIYNYVVVGSVGLSVAMYEPKYFFAELHGPMVVWQYFHASGKTESLDIE